MSGIDPQLLGIFRAEAGERLDTLADELLRAESGGGSPEAVEAMFRAAHSIKGNAGMLGFQEASEIAGALEDLLEDARSAGGLRPGLAGPMLAAADAVRRVLDGTQGVAAAAVAALRTAADAESRADAPPSLAPSTPDPVADEPVADGIAPAAPAAAGGASARTMRVAAERVDRLFDLAGETTLHQRRLTHLIGRQHQDERVTEELAQGDRLLGELQQAMIDLRTLPLSTIVGAFPRAVRDMAAEEGRDVTLTLAGTDTQLDRVILDGISETLVHVLRNAIAHGIEPPAEREAAGKPRVGELILRAEPRGGIVAVTVSDDGRGVSAELLARAEERGSLADVLADAGFSTAASVGRLAGRGVGLDAVKRHVESLGGSLEVASETGAGSTFTLLLPLTVALLHLLLVERGGQVFGLPMASVLEVLKVENAVSLGGRTAVEVDGRPVPLGDLADAIGATAPPLPPGSPAIVLTSSGQRTVLGCDRLLGEREAVVKALGPMLADVSGYLGAVILPEGGIALVVDPAFLVRHQARRRREAVAAAAPARAPRILVVDDQFSPRELQRSVLEAHGYEVVTAEDGHEALAALAADGAIDLVVTDIDMPGLDGLGLLERLRGREATAALPVVVVSSKGSDDDKRRGAAAGADAYIVKSEFDQQTMLETVGRLVAFR